MLLLPRSVPSSPSLFPFPSALSSGCLLSLVPPLLLRASVSTRPFPRAREPSRTFSLMPLLAGYGKLSPDFDSDRINCDNYLNCRLNLFPGFFASSAPGGFFDTSRPLPSLILMHRTAERWDGSLNVSRARDRLIAGPVEILRGAVLWLCSVAC